MAESDGKRPEDQKWKKRIDDLSIELAGSAITTIIGTGIGFLLAQKTVQQLFAEPSFWVHIVVVTLLGWGLIHFVRRSRALKKQLESLKEKEQIQSTKLKQLESLKEREQIQSPKLVKHNIQHIFPNREACDPFIKEKIKSSSSIKFFLLLGSEFSGKSKVYLPAFHEKPVSNAKVQVLISALDSPFLSDDRLKSIKKDKEDIRSKLDDVKNELNKLKRKMRNKGIAVNWQEHKETLLCKFHLFDDCIIFCFNIVISDNDKVSPYFVIQKNDKYSIYNAFEMYFDFVWSKSTKATK